MSHDDADRSIVARIAKGGELRHRIETTQASSTGVFASECERWDRFNSELLDQMFTNPSFADEYRSAGSFGPVLNLAGPGRGPNDRELCCTLNEKIGVLDGIRERLELLAEPLDSPTATPPHEASSVSTVKPGASRSVFISH
ncbi:MAG TPA: hypothetical protein VF904_00695, partial [Anaeromyxobacteraceae bacterium]